MLISKSSSNIERRGVLRVSSSSPFPQTSRSLSPGSSISYGSSVDSTTTIDGPHTPSTSPIRRITFNGYVAQSIIRDDPLPTPSEDLPWSKSVQMHPENIALSRSSSSVKWLDPLPLLTIKPPQPAPVSSKREVASARIYEEPIVVFVLPPGASRQLEESHSRVSVRAAAESDEEPSMRRGRGLARTRSSANLNVEEARGGTSPPPRAPSAESDQDRRRPRKKARFSLGA